MEEKTADEITSQQGIESHALLFTDRFLFLFFSNFGCPLITFTINRQMCSTQECSTNNINKRAPYSLNVLAILHTFSFYDLDENVPLSLLSSANGLHQIT